jgi:hypothetical protein
MAPVESFLRGMAFVHDQQRLATFSSKVTVVTAPLETVPASDTHIRLAGKQGHACRLRCLPPLEQPALRSAAAIALASIGGLMSAATFLQAPLPTGIPGRVGSKQHANQGNENGETAHRKSPG